MFTVKVEQNEAGKILPSADKVWSYIKELLNSLEKQDILVNTLNSYLDDLLKQADKTIEKLEFSKLTSKKEKEDLKCYASELRKKGASIINTEIIPTFNRLISETPKLFKNSKNIVCDNISATIDNENTGRMDETITFVNNHLLPMAINRETKEYERRLMIELDAMNERVDDYLNQAVADYYSEIELRLSTNVELAARASGGKIASKFMENGLKQFFAAYGGAGGARAGVANAAKHLLKKTGDLFGKKFSRETYNALAHTLKKIGATSAKAIGNVVTVIIEVAQVIFDYATWKNKLKKQVSKGLDDWCDKTIETVSKDLENLKNENIKTLNDIIEDIASSYELDANEDADNIDDLIEKKHLTHRELEEAKL